MTTNNTARTVAVDGRHVTPFGADLGTGTLHLTFAGDGTARDAESGATAHLTAYGADYVLCAGAKRLRVDLDTLAPLPAIRRAAFLPAWPEDANAHAKGNGAAHVAGWLAAFDAWDALDDGHTDEDGEAADSDGRPIMHEGERVTDADTLRERLEESALSVEVRMGWHSPGAEVDASDADEYRILLTTGGPALRILGDLDNGSPTSATLQWQDWGTPWTDFAAGELHPDADAVVQRFAELFWFGA